MKPRQTSEKQHQYLPHIKTAIYGVTILQTDLLVTKNHSQVSTVRSQAKFKGTMHSFAALFTNLNLTDLLRMRSSLLLLSVIKILDGILFKFCF